MYRIYSVVITGLLLCLFLFSAQCFAQEQRAGMWVNHHPCDSIEALSATSFDTNITPPSYNRDTLYSHLEWPKTDLCGEGRVYVEVLIDSTGTVRCATIRRSTNSIFNSNALNAIKQTPFTPGKHNGTPINIWMVVPVEFALR